MVLVLDGEARSFDAGDGVASGVAAARQSERVSSRRVSVSPGVVNFDQFLNPRSLLNTRQASRPWSVNSTMTELSKLPSNTGSYGASSTTCR